MALNPKVDQAKVSESDQAQHGPNRFRKHNPYHCRNHDGHQRIRYSNQGQGYEGHFIMSS